MMETSRMGKIARMAAMLIAAMLIAAAPLCWGGTLYEVAIDTSSQTGVSGGIYFQFNGGLNPDLASIQIETFSIGAPGGLVGVPAPVFNGGVTGSLDALPLVMDNSGGNNDYLHYLTFGSNVFFIVDFLLPPALTGDSGSAFSFGLTASDGLTPVLTLDDSGFIGQISYDTSGIFTTTTLGNDSIETITSASAPASVPEPGTGWLIAGALSAACVCLRRHRKTRGLLASMPPVSGDWHSNVFARARR